MAKNFAKLDRIDHNEPITMENHSEFLYHLQHALLLALREQEILNPMEYRHAEEMLKKQRMDRGKRKQEEP